MFLQTAVCGSLKQQDMQFEQDVLAKSHEIPVVVDFWAPWCGPCRILGPIIEQLAEAQKGKWELVKVNTEEYPDLGEQYDVFSIPNVKLFYKGQVTGEFVGAIPKTAIERWLEEHLPNSHKDDLAQILAALENGENPAALAQLKAFVQQNPGITEAGLALASRIVTHNPAEAKELVAAIQLGHPLFDQAEDIRTLAEWFELPADNGSPAAHLLHDAAAAYAQGQSDAAVERVIEAVATDKTYHSDLPRRVAIALFRLWGPQHPLTTNYRWRFDMALY